MECPAPVSADGPWSIRPNGGSRVGVARDAASSHKAVPAVAMAYARPAEEMSTGPLSKAVISAAGVAGCSNRAVVIDCLG